jgi:hypothetical protein
VPTERGRVLAASVRGRRCGLRGDGGTALGRSEPADPGTPTHTG